MKGQIDLSNINETMYRFSDHFYTVIAEKNFDKSRIYYILNDKKRVDERHHN